MICEVLCWRLKTLWLRCKCSQTGAGAGAGAASYFSPTHTLSLCLDLYSAGAQIFLRHPRRPMSLRTYDLDNSRSPKQTSKQNKTTTKKNTQRVVHSKDKPWILSLLAHSECTVVMRISTCSPKRQPEPVQL